MVRRMLSMNFCSVMLALALAGCSDGGKDVKLADAGGTVTFKGAPLADATVTFIPENGPIAMGVTDLSGKFTLSTGSRSGVAVGNCNVTVTALSGGAAKGSPDAAKLTGPVNSKEAGLARQAEMMKMQQKIAESGAPAEEAMGTSSRSVIPERYNKPDTSALSFPVDRDSSKNQFSITLTE